MTSLAAVHAVLPPNRYPQDKITEAFAEHVLGDASGHEVVRRIHTNTRVGSRYLALPLDRYKDLEDFTAANDAYLEVAVELGVQAVAGALERAGITADEVDTIFSTTITGLGVPSLDARIAARLGFRPDIKRVPLFGLGCVAGAAGISRLHDYLRGWPDHVGVLLSVELCSLTVQRNDTSMANLVASGLFGDGAAAVVAEGSTRAERRGTVGPRVLDTRSHLYPGTEGVMGWDIGADGFKIVLTSEVPDLVHRYLGKDIRALLAEHGLVVGDVGAWLEARGLWREAIDRYERGLAQQMLAEPLYRGLMRCHMALNEPAEALVAYRRCRDLLSILLSVKPGSETEALHQHIRAA